MRTSALLCGLLLVLSAGCGDDADGSIEGVRTERVGEYEHLVADLDYPRPAPSGGDHLPSPGWLNCGAYDGGVPDELAVHSLEHGAVWVALGPDATADDRAAAAELADVAPGRVIVSDVADLSDPAQLVAWGLRLPLDDLADARAADFVEEYVDAATAPEAGSACTGGFGEPPTPPDLPVE